MILAKRTDLSVFRYLLPNMMTTANIFLGFFAVIKATEGAYRQAALAILIASIFDFLDGLFARWLKGSSNFGMQFDSLADLVSFCLAPALIIFDFSLNKSGIIGWILCFLYFLTGALRLARFNIQKTENFEGLPSPAAALFIVGFILFYFELPNLIYLDFLNSFLKDFSVMVFLNISLVTLSFLMISQIQYISFKTINKNYLFYFMILITLFVTMLLIKHEVFVIFFMFIYILSGPIRLIMGEKMRLFFRNLFFRSG